MFCSAVCLQEGSGRQPAKGAREVCQDRRMRPAEAKQVDPWRELARNPVESELDGALASRSF